MAVDPKRALAARPPLGVAQEPCPICSGEATHWTDGWVDCPTCGIYDPSDHADTFPLRQAERRRKQREAGDG